MRKTVLAVFIIILIVGGIFGWRFYNKYYAANTQKEGYVLIPTGANMARVMDSLKPFLKNVESFRAVAADKDLADNIKAGRYHIRKNDNNRRIVRMIKSGRQTDDTFRIGDFDDVYQMVGRVARKTEADSIDFVKEFDKIAREKGLTTAEDLKPYFFADTYNFYWTVTPRQFFDRFEKQYDDFWTEENKNKARSLGLTIPQIYALASIVEKESGGKPDEQGTIAGLYLNRYHKGMRLQSDPTVIYAVKKQSGFRQDIKRVYYKDLKTDSPYNTYRNAGIPPGPISVVQKRSVENVLNSKPNNYIYMCANPRQPGYHKFTDDPQEHAQNAREYQNWLNEKQIK